MRNALLALPLALLMASSEPALAQEEPEKVEFDISTREIPVASNFTGIEIVVFGSIDNARARKPGEEPYDVVIVISGPQQALNVWHKERVAGIWVNGTGESFVSVPSFYAVLSTRQIDTIASPETLKTLGIGIDNVRLGGGGVFGDAPTYDKFRTALIRLKEAGNLFQQTEGSINFIGRSLFRGKVALPTNVPIGRYLAQVYLFRNGQLLSQNEGRLNVRKAGFERSVYLLAFRYPFIYGLISVVIAVVAGFLAWLAMGRD
jgi:uncharacterized protein (TIGR02186 family)